jgi:hypothetical protein
MMWFIAPRVLHGRGTTPRERGELDTHKALLPLARALLGSE